MLPTDSAARAGAQDVIASNSLADLAARIQAEHEASAVAIKHGLDHAITCGRLLLEAKAQLQHGQWLPWLREHCGVPERSARRYMELAAYAADQIGQLADSALDGAAEAIPDLAAIRRALEADDWKVAGDFAVRRFLNSPFTAFDFDVNGDSFRNWIGYKLRHQLKLPNIAAWCFDVADCNGGHPALRLCPYDELLDALKALAPLVNAKRDRRSPPIKFDCASFDSMTALQGAIVTVELTAVWSIGGVLKELQDRDRLSEEQYSKEWDELHRQVMARLDQKIADHERERASRGEEARP